MFCIGSTGSDGSSSCWTAIAANPGPVIHITTKNISLVYRVNGRDGRLYQMYLGSKLKDADIQGN